MSISRRRIARWACLAIAASGSMASTALRANALLTDLGRSRPVAQRWTKEAERVRIVNIRDYQDHTFYLWPRDMEGGGPGSTVLRVRDDGTASLLALEPLALPWNMHREGIQLIAVPRNLQKAWAVDPEAILRSGAVIRTGTGLWPSDLPLPWVNSDNTALLAIRGLPDRLVIEDRGRETSCRRWVARPAAAMLLLVATSAAGMAGLRARTRRARWGRRS